MLAKRLVGGQPPWLGPTHPSPCVGQMVRASDWMPAFFIPCPPPPPLPLPVSKALNQNKEPYESPVGEEPFWSFLWGARGTRQEANKRGKGEANNEGPDRKGHTL